MRRNNCLALMAALLAGMLGCSTPNKWQGKYISYVPMRKVVMLNDSAKEKIEVNGTVYNVLPRVAYYDLEPIWLDVTTDDNGKLQGQIVLIHPQRTQPGPLALPIDSPNVFRLPFSKTQQVGDTLYYEVSHGHAMVGYAYRRGADVVIGIPGDPQDAVSLLNPFFVRHVGWGKECLTLKDETSLPAHRKRFLQAQLAALRRGEQFPMNSQAPFVQQARNIRYLEQLIARL